MKNLSHIFIFLFYSINVFGQDLIFRNNGNSIKCYISSEDSFNVFFDVMVKNEKKSTFLAKSEIKKIIYQSKQNNESEPNNNYIERRGSEYYVNNKKLREEELNDLLSNNIEAYQIYNNANSKKALTYLFGGVGGFILGRSLVASDISSNAKTYGLVSSMGLIGIGLIIEGNINSNIKRSIRVYNKDLLSSFSPPKNIQINFGVTKNGIGFIAKL